jgi:NRAMP (natural resistance-associated macrophage protein)-like metal ion transporter
MGSSSSNGTNSHYVAIHKEPGWGEGRDRQLVYHRYDQSTSYRRIFESPDRAFDSPDIASLTKKAALRIEHDGNINWFNWGKFWRYTGPGWLMSIAYLDPGNLESDLQTGANTGYQLLWVLWWATVLGWLVQSLSARLGCVTGKHLAEVCRYEYGTKTGLALWILTELAIIGSDIQEVVGSAIAMNMLFGWKTYIGCLVTAFDTFTFMLIHYFGVRWMELIFTALIFVMVVTFSIEFSIANPDGIGIGKGWLFTECNEDGTDVAVGMIGAVIMPHNLFLHSALVQSRIIDRANKRAVQEANYYFTLEGAISLAVSFYINLTIVAVFAAGGDWKDHDVGLENAGDYLKYKFGSAARVIWAIGLLAAGQSSTMTGTLAGQHAMQGFLNIRWAPWKRTLLTRSIALVPSLLVAVSFTNDMDTLNEWLNIQQSIQLPFALIPLLVFNCNERIMGDFRLHGWKEIGMWMASIGIIAINIYIAWTSVVDMLSTSAFHYIMVSLCVLLYVWFNVWIVWVGRVRDMFFPPGNSGVQQSSL